MAIAFESLASNTATSATSLTITKPSGTVEGDLLVAAVQMLRGSTINTPPTGWTVEEPVGTYSIVHAYYKIAGAAEPANYTWDEATSTNWEGVILRFSGVDGTTPLDATDTTEDTAYDTTMRVAGVTTTVDNALAVAIGSAEKTKLVTAYPGGTWTDGYAGSALTLGVAYKVQATAGSTGVADFTLASGDRTGSVTLSFAPAAAAGFQPAWAFNATQVAV